MLARPVARIIEVGFALFLVAAVTGAVLYGVHRHRDVPAATPVWPQELAGIPLTPASTPVPAAFRSVDDTPLGHFRCHDADVVVRQIDRESRAFPPAQDCFREVGYRVQSISFYRDSGGRRWEAFVATREEEILQVRELYCDARGGTWPDVDSWRWTAFCGKTTGPWWNVTLIEDASSATSVAAMR